MRLTSAGRESQRNPSFPRRNEACAAWGVPCRYTCSMKHVDTPQTRCRAGVARGDITPPVGIYHRLWGAAVHDRATGAHRPLLATLLWLEAPDGLPDQRQLVVAMDHCIL